MSLKKRINIIIIPVNKEEKKWLSEVKSRSQNIKEEFYLPVTDQCIRD